MPFLKVSPFVSSTKEKSAAVYPEGEEDVKKTTSSFSISSTSTSSTSHCKRRQDSNLFSKWTHTYISQLLRRGMKKQLTPDDIPEIEDVDDAKYLCETFEKAWEEELAKNGPEKARLYRTVFKVLSPTFGAAGLLYLLFALLRISQAVILGLFLSFFNDPATQSSIGIGFAYGVGLGFACLVNSFVGNMCPFIGLRTAMQLRVAFMSLVYKKMLKLSISHTTSSGVIINIISNDVQRFEDVTPYFHYLWVGPIEVCISVYFIHRYISYAAFAAIISIFLVIPIQGAFARQLGKIRSETVKHRDSRIRNISDMLVGMMVVKLYAWEAPFRDRIVEDRREELRQTRRASLIRAYNESFYFSSSTIISLFTFITFYLIGGIFTPTNIFATNTLLSNIRLIMTGFFPKGLQFGYEAIVSFKRIQEFLLIEEVDSSNANIKSLEEIWPEITEARRMREEEKKKKSGEDEKAGAAAAAAVVDITDNQNQTVIKITDSSTPNASTTLSSDFSNKDVLCVLASASFHWFTQHLNSPAQQQLHRKNNGTGPNLDILEGVNLTLERGKLVGVCGAVGSGKSSLANALLGELQMSSSSVGGGGGLMAFQKSITTSSTSTNKRKLKVAYSPQSAYIIAGSIKSNILFGSEFDEAWFWAVVKACRLDQDVSKMPEGVDTIVGERGITLSGGQKARLQLARAVYFDADIYILDDPLSALDTKVGRRLFDQCIKGNLLSLDPIHGHRSQPAAVLLITHQLQFIKECDEIRIISNGRLQDPIFKSNFHQESEHEEILQKAVSALSLNNTGGDGCTNRFSAPSLPNTNNDAASSPQFVKNVAADSDEAIAAITLAKRDHIKENIEKIKSIEEEKKKKKLELESSAILKKGGKMTKKSSLAYLADFFISGSTLFTQSLLFIGLLGGQAIMNTGSWWLSSWSKESPADQLANGRFNALVYLGFVLAVVIVGVLRAVLFFSICIHSSKTLFDRMMESIVRSPIYFFQINHHGQIMNRFSKDLNILDELLPLTLFDFLQSFFLLAGTFVMAMVFIPYLIVVVPFFFYGFYKMRSYFISTSRQVKALEATTRSPIYSKVSATLEGLAVIRSFDAQARTLEEYYELVNTNTRVFFSFICCSRWLALRLDFMAALFLVMIVAVSLWLRSLGAINAHHLGLVLSYSIQCIILLQFTVRQSAEVEIQMISVERIVDYTNLTPEAASIISDNRPPADWPSRGGMVIKNLSMIYPGTDKKVLDNLNVTIPAGKKVGIVGRTGAGKSSILQAIFRLVEPLPGSLVELDGVDLSKIGLNDLRSRISIIPQDPFCFKGTLRFNIDPFDQYSDEELWKALDAVELKKTVESLPEKMDAVVDEGGANWSVGERQLICLTRAILKKSKVIVLDEATSNIDLHTDTLIQRAIRSENGLFAQSTVLTIAHRLDTVIDFDLILVLDEGRVAEFGSPEELLFKKQESDDGAWFAKMVAEMGPEARKRLLERVVKK